MSDCAIICKYDKYHIVGDIRQNHRAMKYSHIVPKYDSNTSNCLPRCNIKSLDHEI